MRPKRGRVRHEPAPARTVQMLVQTYHALRGRRCVQLIVNAERKCGKLSDRYLLFLLCVCRQVLKRDVDLG